MKNTTIIAKIGGKIIENPQNLDNTLNQLNILLLEKEY